MKRMFINLLVYLLISSYQLKSQTLYSVDKWMEYIEEMASVLPSIRNVVNSSGVVIVDFIAVLFLEKST